MSGMNPIYTEQPQPYSGMNKLPNYIQPSFGSTLASYLLRISSDSQSYFNKSPAVVGSILSYTRNTSATYQDSSGLIQTAAQDELRYDYSTGRRALLFEAQQTNLIMYSDDLTGYVVDGVSLSSSDFSPVFGDTGKRITENTETGIHTLNSPIVDIDSGVRYFFGYFVRDAGRRYVQIPILSAAGGETRYANFDTVDGVCTYVGSNSTPTVRRLADGYMVGITFVAAGSTQDRLRAFMIPSGNAGRFASYTGDGVSALDVTGFMAYQGYPSSYIPTAGSAVTRSPDIATVDISTLDLSAGFTVYFEGAITSPGRVFQMGTTDNRITLRCDGTNLIFEVYSGGVLQASYTSSGIAAGDGFKFAARVEVNNINVAFNGAAATADTSAAFVEPDELYIAASDNATSDKPAVVNVVDLRIDAPLSDSELEALTA